MTLKNINFIHVFPGRWIVNATYKQWWSKDTKKNYKEIVKQCFLDYYGNQTAGPYRIEGRDITVSRHVDLNI